MPRAAQQFESLSPTENMPPLEQTQIAETKKHPPIDLAAVRKMRQEKKVREVLPTSKETGSYKEADDPRAYLAELEGIAQFTLPRYEGSLQGISEDERQMLFDVSMMRMNETDVTPEDKRLQLQHLEEVHGLAKEGGLLYMAAHPDQPIDLKAVERAAAGHDCSKYCCGYAKGEKDAAPQLVVNRDGKPMTNPDLMGHNAHSAVEMKIILMNMGVPEEDAMKVAKIILLHSTGEFPDELAQMSVNPEAYDGKLEVYRIPFFPNFGPVYFVRGAVEGPEAQIMHSADLLVGAGVESYPKYLKAHEQPTLARKDEATAAKRPPWTRFDAAMRSCYDSSAKNFLTASISEMRKQFGYPRVAKMQAVREYITRVAPNDPEAQAYIATVNQHDYTKPAPTSADSGPFTAYQGILAKAEQYYAGKQASLGEKFLSTYVAGFFNEQKISLEEDAEFWTGRLAVISAMRPADDQERAAQIRGQREAQFNMLNAQKLLRGLEGQWQEFRK